MNSSSLQELFVRNRQWARQLVSDRPGFFRDLTKQQRPRYMWIGCSDSRVPANQITGLAPGEIFVHRNVANIVVPADLNCLSTIQFAIDQLEVQDLMVVGHYGCGGVVAALGDARVGLADNWLRHVKDVRDRHADLLASISETARADCLCELNVIEQVVNVVRTTVVQDAWTRGQVVRVHGWVYAVSDGLLRDLGVSIEAGSAVREIQEKAIAAVSSRNRSHVRVTI